AYSASAKDSCFIGKLGQGSGCISPESGSLFQDFLNGWHHGAINQCHQIKPDIIENARPAIPC
ncbi:hypothetical protein, partial [Azotobacter salinestris]